MSLLHVYVITVLFQHGEKQETFTAGQGDKQTFRLVQTLKPSGEREAGGEGEEQAQ